MPDPTRSTRAWVMAEERLADRDHATIRAAALDALTLPDRATIKAIEKYLTKTTRSLGEASALRLLAVIGGLLVDHPEWMEVQQ